MPFNKSDRSDAPVRRKGGIRRRKKVCVFCGKEQNIDYKDQATLKKYVSESGKILPRRITGNCVMPTEGIFAKVLNEGEIRAGDRIITEAEPAV